MQRNNKKRSQLNQEERIEIYALRKQGVSMRGIGRILKRPHSTISKDFSRNRDYRGWDKYRYDPLKAEKKTKKGGSEGKAYKVVKEPQNVKKLGEKIYRRSRFTRDRGDYRKDEKRMNRNNEYKYNV